MRVNQIFPPPHWTDDGRILLYLKIYVYTLPLFVSYLKIDMYMILLHIVRLWLWDGFHPSIPKSFVKSKRNKLSLSDEIPYRVSSSLETAIFNIP